MFKNIFIFLIPCIFFLSAQASTRDPSAEQAILLDFETGQIILEKNADELMKPASMAKLMTIYIVFEKLKNKQLSLEDKFVVSEKAWKKRGSRSFLEPGQNVTISDLLRGIIVQSGNDAAIVLAEGISGTEDIFSDLMNSVAEELGMKNTVFKNSTGWPNVNQYTTARDLALLSIKIIREFPELYKIFAEKNFIFNGINQGNRNPILYNNLVFGSDGLKTGHTQESGYGLAASAVRENLRFVLVLNGMKTQRQRKEESSRLLNSAFRQYKKINLYNAGEKVIDARIWLGEKDKASLVVKEDVNLLLNSVDQRKLKVSAKWNDPLIAPIFPGVETGKLVISLSDTNIEFPLFVESAVSKQGFFNRILSTLEYLIWGSIK